MEPTVLAGPVEFSPADIALILAVLAGIFVVIMSPGMALVAFAAHRRRKAQRPGPAAGAALLGAAGGLALCCAVSALVGALLRDSLGSATGLLAVLASWAACGAVALRLSSRAEPDPRQADGSVSATDGGWGR
jgi:protein-S-isoprenylcysteine O-methyltransferase Ste14